MSVPKNRRELSELEFYHNGIKLRDVVMDLLIRDFGIKIKKHDFDFLKTAHGMSEEDSELVEYLCKKYRVAEHILYEFPVWFMENERETILNILRRFMMHLRYGDGIVVNSEKSHENRKYHILQARTECFLLVDEMEYVAKVYPVNMKKYLPILDVIHYEIKLLTRLEKKDNDRWRKWKSNHSEDKGPQHIPTPEISAPERKQQLKKEDKDKPTPFDNVPMKKEPVYMKTK